MEADVPLIPLAILAAVAVALYYAQKISHDWSTAGQLESMVKANMTPADIAKHFPTSTAGSISTIAIAAAVIAGVVFLAPRRRGPDA